MMTEFHEQPDRPVLEAEDISVRFGGLQALARVSISVPVGATVGILGPNGAGKTTFFNALTGFLRPTTGRVIYQGDDITGESPEGRARRGLVRTFQRLQVFEHLSIYENVLVGFHQHGTISLLDDVLSWRRGKAAKARLREQASALLEQVGLRDYAAAHPSDVPFGVLRRLEIARALAAGPKVLLLDEPASGLALQERESLADSLDEGVAGPELSLVLVEHDVDMVMRLASYIYVLDFGQLIAEGTPAEIRNSSVVQDAYLGRAS